LRDEDDQTIDGQEPGISEGGSVGIHPSASYEIARLHSEERLARSLAAYEAVQARNGQPAKLDAEQESGGRFRFVGRLRWRGAGARGSGRPAV
jgi:hypothetical protein